MGGVVALLLGLVLAWAVVGTLHLGLGHRLVAEPRQLVRAHLDYLLMSLFLLLFSVLVPDLPTPWAALLLVGAFTNPALFVAMAVRPGIQRERPFAMLSTASFLATTAGFGAAGWYSL
jgi:hypothetical protein